MQLVARVCQRQLILVSIYHDLHTAQILLVKHVVFVDQRLAPTAT